MTAHTSFRETKYLTLCLFRTVNAVSQTGRFMIRIPIAIFIIAICSSLSEAQFISQLSPQESIDSTVSTPPPTPKRLLIPANSSFMERYLWDYDGLFRKWGWADSLTPKARKSELELRRTMLTWHQIGGFVTEGLMIGAVYFGQRLIDGDRSANKWHQPLVTALIGTYSITGLLAVLSPPPLIRRDDETSTTTIHKALAWVHFTGMFLTPLFAQFIHRNDYNGIARFHQVSGYITLTALTASLITVTF